MIALLGPALPADAQAVRGDSLCLALVRVPADSIVERVVCVPSLRAVRDSVVTRDSIRWVPRDSIRWVDSTRWNVRDSVVIRWVDSLRPPPVIDTTTPPAPIDSTKPDTTKPPPVVDTLPQPPPTPPAGVQLPRATPIIPSVEQLPCTHRVSVGLQAALTAARGGAVVCLPPGAVYTGNFTVPARGDSGLIVLRTDTVLPPGRIRPSTAAALRLAKIVSPNGFAALTFQARARQTVLLGLEITTDSTLATGATTLLSIGTGQESQLADLPSDIGLDRVYIHGFPHQNMRRAVAGNGRSMWMLRSWCSEVHMRNADSQCWISWNGAGPILLEDNYLAAASENIMFGGADPRVPGLVAEDVTIRRNHFEKPVSWIGKAWLIKALIESKASRRVLVEENVLSGQWYEDAVGHAAMTVKSSNQSGSCTRCDTSDWTIRRNLFQHIGTWLAIAGRADQDGGNLTDSTVRRLAIVENWIDSVSVPPYTNPIRALVMFTSRNDEILLERNTVAGAGPSLESSVLLNLTSDHPVPVTGLTLQANVFPRGRYGLIATGVGEGLKAWAKVAATSRYDAMAFLAPRPPSVPYPSGTSWHTNVDAAAQSVGAVTRATVAAGVRGVVVLP